MLLAAIVGFLPAPHWPAHPLQHTCRSCIRIVSAEPSDDVSQFRENLNARRDLMDPLALRALEQRETEQRRRDLELRTDLTPEAIAVRRLSDDVALGDPSSLPKAPHDSLSPHDVVVACMVAMQENDELAQATKFGADWGLRYNWAFFGEQVRANWRGDADEFVRDSNNNRNGLANCEWFDTDEESIRLIEGTPTRGALCKMVVRIRCRDSIPMPARDFLWVLQRERRPPHANCWLISQVLAVDRALEELTM